MLVDSLSLPLKSKHPEAGDSICSPKLCSVTLYSPKPFTIAWYTIGTQPMLVIECQTMSNSVNE